MFFHGQKLLTVPVTAGFTSVGQTSYRALNSPRNFVDLQFFSKGTSVKHTYTYV